MFFQSPEGFWSARSIDRHRESRGRTSEYNFLVLEKLLSCMERIRGRAEDRTKEAQGRKRNTEFWRQELDGSKLEAQGKRIKEKGQRLKEKGERKSTKQVWVACQALTFDNLVRIYS